MKFYFASLVIDRLAIFANVKNPLHVSILHWAKNQVQIQLGRAYRAECLMIEVA